jgi:hypothetical protein
VAGSESADARTVSVRVRRSSGRLYASGTRTLRKGQTVVPVTGGLVARSGRYSVIATVRLNGRTTTLRGSFSLPAA